MHMPGDEIRQIREGLAQAIGRPLCAHEFGARLGLPADSFAVSMMESEGATGPLALALRYLSQGLPGFRGDLPEWSYESTFHERWPTALVRYWWPRFMAPIERRHLPARMGFISWIDDPRDRKEATLKAACEAFRLRIPENG